MRCFFYGMFYEANIKQLADVAKISGAFTVRRVRCYVHKSCILKLLRLMKRSMY